MLRLFFLFLFTCVNTAMCQDSQNPKIRLERFKTDKLKESENEYFREMAKINYLQHSFAFKNFPQNKNLYVDVQRPLFGNDWKNFLYIRLENDKVVYKSKDFKHEVILPFFSFSSLGFFPGEKIVIKFSTQDDSFQHKISFIPNPMELADNEGKILLSAELVGNTNGSEIYLLKLHQIPEGENLVFISKSGNEIIKSEMKYSKSNPHMIIPGVIDKEGGIEVVTFIRENGDKLSLPLPWGKEVIKNVLEKKSYDATIFEETDL